METDNVEVAPARAGNRPMRPCLPPGLERRVSRIVQCRMRPDLLPREPILSEKERQDLEAVLPVYRAYLAPGAKAEITACLTRLRAHYFVPDVPTALQDALTEDWVDDLSAFPAWAVKEACDRYRRMEGTKAPRPADIIDLAKGQIEVERSELCEVEDVLVPTTVAEDLPAIPACAVWKEHHDDICCDFGMEAYESWIGLCIPESDVDGVLTLAVPTVLIRDHIEANYKDGLQKTLGRTVVIVQRGWPANANTAKGYKTRLAEEKAEKEAALRSRGVAG